MYNRNYPNAIQFAWEYGTGYGHLSKLIPLAQQFQKQSYTVMLNIKYGHNLQHRIPPTLPWTMQPKTKSNSRLFDATATFTQFLLQLGFADIDFLSSRVEYWLDSFHKNNTQLILCEHSPVAMLSARIANIPAVTVGSGFFNPTCSPLFPVLIPSQTPSVQDDQKQREQLLQNLNSILIKHNAKPMDRPEQLYADARAQCLITYSELDHFGPRPHAKYWGTWDYSVGSKPMLPTGIGPKIFAYLKPFPGLIPLIEELHRLQWPCYLVSTSFTDAVISRYTTNQLKLSREPVDINHVAKWCDFAILNANEGTLVPMLKHGKPCLNIPVQLEQSLLAKKIVQLGAGGTANGKNEKSCLSGLHEIAARYKELSRPARAFAQKYALQNPTDQLERCAQFILDQIR
jgi:hypothetical protein